MYISYSCVGWWLGVDQAPSHHPNQQYFALIGVLNRFLAPFAPLPWIFNVINKCWFHCAYIMKFMVHFTKMMVFGQFHYFLNKCILLSTCTYCISPCLFVERLWMESNKDYFELWTWTLPNKNTSKNCYAAILGMTNACVQRKKSDVERQPCWLPFLVYVTFIEMPKVVHNNCPTYSR